MHNKKFKFKKLFSAIISLIIFFTIFFFAINIYILKSTSEQIFKKIEELPQKHVALLLGAKVYYDGRMSDILNDRAQTAVELFNAKKVQKILVSGDHSRKNYDEVNTIKNYLLKNEIPPEDIFLDHAGFDTYDSLYRTKAIFQIDSLIIVTQEFHLPRALYIANGLNIDAIGIVADKHEYIMGPYNQVRESLARLKAFLDVTLNSNPKFLGPQIPITADSKLSWDQ